MLCIEFHRPLVAERRRRRRQDRGAFRSDGAEVGFTFRPSPILSWQFRFAAAVLMLDERRGRESQIVAKTNTNLLRLRADSHSLTREQRRQTERIYSNLPLPSALIN